MAKTPVKLTFINAGQAKMASCGGCSHVWSLRVERPQRCPKCQAPFEDPKEAA